MSKKRKNNNNKNVNKTSDNITKENDVTNQMQNQNDNNQNLNAPKNSMSKAIYLVLFILIMMYLMNGKNKNTEENITNDNQISEEQNEENNSNVITTTNLNLKDLKKVLVKRVVDGDTFIYEENNNEVRVRLIGINTPESVTPEENLKAGQENTIEGKVASEYTTNLIENEYVYLEYDKEQYDKYDRELAYVYLKDGRMVQDILLVEGYAELMTVKPNVKYENRFKLETK